ncbi:MAG: hypothetical protein FGF52_01430 [Candidatus Brockarchaeota archaeon]|nr:hypothetical protein [Candidatus Brockarchaeota archaeon]
MQQRGIKRRIVPLLVLTIVLSILIESNVSAQVFLSDFCVDLRVNMSGDAIAFYTANMTLGPWALEELKEANWTLRIQLPKWASPNLVNSTEIPSLLLNNGKRIRIRLENGTDYDYLAAEIPPIDGDSLNIILRIGFVQRDKIVGRTVFFKLPVLTGFNIMPKYVNFTFRTSGRIELYSQYLPYFDLIFENNTCVGLWKTYFRTKIVESINGSIAFPEAFEKCVIKSLHREIVVTGYLDVTVRDRLRIKYIGERSTSEILNIILPSSISRAVRVKDALGSLRAYTNTLTENTSIIRVYSRYSLNPSQEYEATVEYDIPIKNTITAVSGGRISILIKDLANYSDVVNAYSLSVKVESGGNWKILVDSIAIDVEKNGVFSTSVANAMPSLLVQPLSITFTHVQIAAGRGISIMLGLLTLAILIVADMFREKAVRPVEELKEEKEIKSLVEKTVEALAERIEYETRLEEAKVKNALGRLSSKEYKISLEEYERRISGLERKIIKTVEQISAKNPRIGEEVKRSYDVFKEVNSDLRKMIDNTIEKFGSGRITRSVFENLSRKYLKDNRRRREAAADDIYRSLEKLGL